MLQNVQQILLDQAGTIASVETDVTETQIREMGLAAGLVDNKVCAVDDTWSGLRFVIRVKDRIRSA